MMISDIYIQQLVLMAIVYSNFYYFVVCRSLLGVCKNKTIVCSRWGSRSATWESNDTDYNNNFLMTMNKVCYVISFFEFYSHLGLSYQFNSVSRIINTTSLVRISKFFIQHLLLHSDEVPPTLPQKMTVGIERRQSTTAAKERLTY